MSATPRENGKTPPGSPTSDRVLEHEYDGIREYDNPMPRWWLLTFAGTVLFSAIYLLNVGPVGNGQGRVADYETDVAKQLAVHPPASNNVTDASLLGLSKNVQVVALGKKLYATNCAACHGPDGGGVIGPNLTDEYWLHGARPAEIHKTVVEGVLAKGMPPWGKILKPDQVSAVVVYIASLQGSRPTNAKAPQGVKSEP
jgi:cytochrome c oxidase cbb3-type subunit III